MNNHYFEHVKSISSYFDCIRELVDNAIDAKATKISIKFDSAFSSIECTDNGSGFDFDDLNSFNLQSQKYNVINYANPNKLGFRSRSLYSIANLSSDLLICSRSNNGSFFYSYQDGIKPHSSVNTTQIKILNPLRNSYLEDYLNQKSEIRIIYDFITKYSCYYDVQFLINGNKIDRSRFLNDKMQHLEGSFSFDKNLINYELTYSFDPNSSKSAVFIDGRLISNEQLSHSLRKSLNSILNRKSPYLKLFANINSINRDLVHISHSSSKSIAKFNTKFEKVFLDNIISELQVKYRKIDMSLIKDINFDDISDDTAESNNFFDRVVGQAFNSFIIAEKDDYLYLIDQHAVSERILMERYLSIFNSAPLDNSVYLLKKHIHISDDMQSCHFVESHIDDFSKIGIIFEIHVSDVYLIGIPKFLDFFEESDWIEIIQEFMNNSIVNDRRLNQMAFDIANFSCKKAIKFGDRLSEKEISSFIEHMEYTDYVSFCNHGRNTICKLSYDKLCKFFDR